jgi:hypothetical protein
MPSHSHDSTLIGCGTSATSTVIEVGGGYVPGATATTGSELAGNNIQPSMDVVAIITH